MSRFLRTLHCPTTLFAILLALPAIADVPRLVTYQGKLTGGEDPVTLRIRFYDAATGGNVLFDEAHAGVTRTNGLFTINIGSQTTGGVPDAALDAPEVWLGVSVNDGDELTPRTRLVMVPWAAKAKMSEILVRPGTMESAVTVWPSGNVGINSSSDSPLAGLTVATTEPKSSGTIYVRQSEPSSATDRIFFARRRNSTDTGWLDWIFEVTSGDEPSLSFLRYNRPDGGTDTYARPLNLGWDGVVHLHDPNGSNGNKQIDFTGGYSVWRDDAGAGSDDTRLWVNGPDHGEITFGPRGSASILDLFRVRSTMARFDGAIQIMGGADLAEPGHVSDAGLGADAIHPGMVVSIDPGNPGKLVLATEAYDRKVAGVISGAGGVQPGVLMTRSSDTATGRPSDQAPKEHPIAMAGKVYVWCDASYGAIDAGDMLTTSATPGHAMKAADRKRAFGAVIGKAMTRLEQGRGLVLVLVNLQ
jgi:hypothetical protein